MPQRAIVRLSVGYLVDWIRIVSPMAGSDLWASLALATYYQAATDHMDVPDKGSGHDGAAAPLSAYTLGQILNLPRETARRKVLLLARRGLISRSEKGYVLSPATIRSEPIRMVSLKVAGASASFQKSMATLTDAADAKPLQALSYGQLTIYVMRLSNAFCLRLLDNFARDNDGDPVSPLLFCAVSVANTQHLEMKPDSLYSEFNPRMPDSERRPVPGLEVSRLTGMPRETVRRYLSGLVKDNRLRRVRGGFIANEGHFDKPEVKLASSRVAAIAQRFYSGLNQLAQYRASMA